MPSPTPSQHAGEVQRSRRFARLFGDGSMGLEPADTDFLTARRRLIDSHDDPDVELLEVEITVVRSHGSPHVQLVTEAAVECPNCGETVYDSEATAEINRLRAELGAAHEMLRDAGINTGRVVNLNPRP